MSGAGILNATAARLFADHFPDEVVFAGRDGRFPDEGWAALEAAGLPLALLDEEKGGFGLSPHEALDLVRIGGGFASPVPLGETMVANWLLGQAGLQPAEGPASFAVLPPEAPAIRSQGGSWRLQGAVLNAPWGRHAQTMVILAGSHLVRLTRGQMSLEEGVGDSASRAGLPRDTLHFDVAVGPDAVRPAGCNADAVRGAGAILRSMEIAGALEQIVEMTVRYAAERVQFGKPIGKLQAIQQQIAILAGQAAAANAAADIAAAAFGSPHDLDAVAVAKSRAGEAAGIGAAIAHQTHGAIGFTREYRLHLYTTGLWTWRDEFGSERYWNARLGSRVAAGGADALWPFVTGIGALAARA